MTDVNRQALLLKQKKEEKREREMFPFAYYWKNLALAFTTLGPALPRHKVEPRILFFPQIDSFLCSSP